MVFVLISPAKTMAFENARPKARGTVPHFAKRSDALVQVLAQKTPAAIGKLMAISPKLAALNVDRFKNWATADTELALCAYRGDTYVGFDAATLSDAAFDAAQKHVGILSGLYGLLSPHDRIKPYRLEMGTTLAVGGAPDLYAYWGDAITDRINALVKKNGHTAVIGCASNEYLDAVDVSALDVPFIRCDFKELKNGAAVTVGLFAKRARGMMARYIVEQGVSKPDALKKFNANGYAFDTKRSDDANFVFVRKATKT